MARNKATINANISDIKKGLNLYERAKPDEIAQGAVLMALSFHTSIKTFKGQTGYSFYANPLHKVPPHNNNPKSEEDMIQASASIAFAEYDRADRKQGFGLTINQASRDYAELKNKMIFGLHGAYDKATGEMEIDIVRVPNLDENDRFSGMINMPLSEGDLDLALAYAKICIDAIHNGDNPNAASCLRQALDRRIINTIKQERDAPPPLESRRATDDRTPTTQMRESFDDNAGLVFLPYKDLSALLKIGSYEQHGEDFQDPDAHRYILEALGITSPEETQTHNTHGPTYAACGNTEASGWDDEPAPCIAWTQETLEDGQNMFSLIISRDSSSDEAMRDTVVFGLQGIKETDDSILAVTRLVAPTYDKRDHPQPAVQIPVSNFNVEMAVIFAEALTKQIYMGQPIDVVRCLKYTEERLLTIEEDPAPIEVHEARFDEIKPGDLF